MLKDLYSLQNIEVAERAIFKEKKKSLEFRKLMEIKNNFEQKKENYLKLEKELSLLDTQLAAFPKQIKELEEKIAKENKAMYDGSVVKLKELAAREAQLSALTEKLKETQNLNSLYLEEYKQKSKLFEEDKVSLTENHQLFLKIKEEYQKKQEIWEERLTVLAKEKQVLKDHISQEDLIWFENIKEKCNGTPIAKLSFNHVCSGCNTIVPPISFKRTRMGQLTYCEKCGRTLFVEELEEIDN